MRISEFRRACAEEFGEEYSAVLLRDHWLRELGATAQEALSAGVDARVVWEALCIDLAVPEVRRHGRGLKSAPK